MGKFVKLVIFVPKSHSEIVRKTLGDAGAGKLGNYSHFTFTTEGVGRFKPLKGASPYVGEVGKIEEVVEEKIETICEYERIKEVISEVRKVHPYEEVAFDVIPLLMEDEI